MKNFAHLFRFINCHHKIGAMQTEEKISLTFTGMLMFCALIIAGLVIRQNFFPEQQLEIQKIETW